MHSEGYSTWSVCLSVRMSMLILALRATSRPISDIDRFRTTRAWNIEWLISWNDCVREICCENKRKSQMHNRTGLTATWSACSAYLGGTRRPTKGVCRLPYAIYYLSDSPRARPRVAVYSEPSPSISGTVHAQCTEGLHFSAFHFQEQCTYCL